MISVELVQRNRYDDVAAFYKAAGYGGGLRDCDSVLGAWDDGILLGVARLSAEEGHLVLRGMYVEAASQRQGIGTRILEATGQFIGARACWCLPYAHLEEFYARIGFVECSPTSAPRFLGERLRRHLDSGHRVIMMKRAARSGTGSCPE